MHNGMADVNTPLSQSNRSTNFSVLCAGCEHSSHMIRDLYHVEYHAYIKLWLGPINNSLVLSEKCFDIFQMRCRFISDIIGVINRSRGPLGKNPSTHDFLHARNMIVEELKSGDKKTALLVGLSPQWT